MRRRVRTMAIQEDGIALILAVITLAILAVIITAMLSFTASSGRQTSLVRADQQAYALAEAGLNQAVAQLASHYYDSSQTANNTTYVFSPTWFNGAGLASSQQSPSSATACTAGSTCMSWSLVSCSFSSAIAGCSLAPGVGITKGTVVLRGIGAVPNPTGGAATRTRIVTTKIDVTQPAQLVPTPHYWQEIYTGAPASGNCDLSLGQGVAISAPLYVAGDLCMTSSSQIGGSNVNLKVLGWTWLRNSATIGTNNSTPARIGSALIAGGCSDNNNQQPTMISGCTINRNGGSIWDNTPTSQHAATSPTPDTLPAVDWAWAQNAQNNSLPAPSCTNGRSLNEANFALTPSASYTCASAVGSIQYTYSSSGTSTLLVSGDIYFSGNLTIDTGNNLVQYSGLGSVFVAGSVTAANNSFVCVHVANGTCDFANATNSSSSGYWDATTSALLIQAPIAATNLRFQGGLYSATSISLTGGQGCTQGPLVTPGTITVGQQLNGSFPSFPLIQAGSLGTLPFFSLSKPYGGTF